MKTIQHPNGSQAVNGHCHSLEIHHAKSTCDGPVPILPAHSFARRRARIPQSTDFCPLRRTRLLVVADDDNIFLTARDAGLSFSYGSVLERLQQVAHSVTPIAMITAQPGDDRREAYLLSRGWKVQCIRREIVITTSGPTVKGNADFDFVYETARLLTTGHFDAALLLTGDGDLAVAIARCVKRTTPQVRVLTLAMPGGASRRLRTRSDIFEAFIPAGLDICRPRSRRRPGRFSRCFGAVDKPPSDSMHAATAVDFEPRADGDNSVAKV